MNPAPSSILNLPSSFPIPPPMLAQIDKVTPDHLQQAVLLLFAVAGMCVGVGMLLIHFFNLRLNQRRYSRPAAVEIADQPVRATVEGTVTTSSAAKEFDPALCANLHKQNDARHAEHERQFQALRADLRAGQEASARQFENFRTLLDQKLEASRLENKSDVVAIYNELKVMNANNHEMRGEMKHVNISLSSLAQRIELHS